MSPLEYALYTILVCLSILIVPGQIFFLTIEEAVRSRKGALAMTSGIVVAEIILLIMLFAGFSAFLNQVVPTLRLAGSVLLFILGGQSIARSIHPTVRKKGSGSLAPFNRGFMMTTLNPPFIVWLFTAGLSVLDSGAALGITSYIIFASALLSSSVTVVLTIIIAVSLGRHLIGESGLRVLHIISGLAFIGLGISLLLPLLTTPP